MKRFETEPTEWLGLDGRCRGWMRTITLVLGSLRKSTLILTAHFARKTEALLCHRSQRLQSSVNDIMLWNPVSREVDINLRILNPRMCRFR